MIAVLPSMIHPKQPFSDGLGGLLKNKKEKSCKSCDLQDSFFCVLSSPPSPSENGQHHTSRHLSVGQMQTYNWVVKYWECQPYWNRSSYTYLMCMRGFLRQFLYCYEDSVRTTSVKCRMKREMVHQMRSDWTTTEVDTHERTDDFAVLITEGFR